MHREKNDCFAANSAKRTDKVLCEASPSEADWLRKLYFLVSQTFVTPATTDSKMCFLVDYRCSAKAKLLSLTGLRAIYSVMCNIIPRTGDYI